METNCWEFKKCGREPNGSKVLELGICPVATEVKANGINRGENGGRSCWVVPGSLCRGKVQGAFVSKISKCMECDFYKKVFKEEFKNGSWSKTIDVVRLLT